MSLKVKNLNQILSGKRILTSISFEAPKNKIVAFLGPNGAGKTTLLKTIIGLHPISSIFAKEGSIILNDMELINLPVHTRVSHGLVYAPQHSSLFHQMSVRDNLYMVYHYHPFWEKRTKKEFAKKLESLLHYTTLEKTINQQAENLSGGQQRKVEVVRALLMNPRAILFDEPFAGVDPKSIYELKKLFSDLAKKGISVLISDHHVDQLLSIATMVYVVIDGKIITSGSIEDIMKNEHLKEGYLGSQFHAEVTERFLS